MSTVLLGAASNVGPAIFPGDSPNLWPTLPCGDFCHPGHFTVKNSIRAQREVDRFTRPSRQGTSRRLVAPAAPSHDLRLLRWFSHRSAETRAKRPGVSGPCKLAKRRRQP